jgi:hypothetical protein
MRRALLLTLFVGCVLPAAPARADVLHLKDGTKVEGEVFDLGDTYKVRLPSGITVYYQKERVEKLVKQTSPAQEYRQRVAAIAPDDAEELLKLARWCVKNGLKTEAVKTYRAATSIASLHLRTIKRELADLCDEMGRHHDAYDLYASLGPECATRARWMRWKLDRVRLKSYHEGVQLLADHKYRDAIVCLERAYSVSVPAGEGDERAISTEEVLAKLIAAKAAQAKKLSGNRVALRPCPGCEAAGIVVCGTCKGKGKVKRRVYSAYGGEMRWKLVSCGDCNGTGKARCGECFGASVDLRRTASWPRAALRSLGEFAYESRAASIGETLRYLYRWTHSHVVAIGGGAPTYSSSKELRDMIKEFPPLPGELRALNRTWRKTKPPVRGNFLANVGLELLQVLSPVPKGMFEDAKGVSSAAQWGVPRVDADVLSAFPDEYDGREVRVRGMWYSAKDAAQGLPRAMISLNAGRRHELHPFVWKPASKEVHGRLGRALAMEGLAARARQYPYEKLDEQLAGLSVGDRVEFLGTLFSGNDPTARVLLEVWAIRARPSEQIERLAEALARPVTLRFDNTWLDDAAKMLAELSGVPIALDVPDAAMPVNGRLRDVAFGRALTKLVTPIGLYWYPKQSIKDGIVVSATISDADRKRVAQILKLLPE